MPIVSVIQVGKSFGAERIFAGVNFQIDEYDRIGLVGLNGAGKSTLLNLLAGREEPDEGTIAIARNTRIGYLTQTIDFHPQNTLREEMLTVFAEVREWEHGLSELALELATQAAQSDSVLHEQLLNRYDELQTRFEHVGGYTYENRIDQVLDIAVCASMRHSRLKLPTLRSLFAVTGLASAAARHEVVRSCLTGWSV